VSARESIRSAAFPLFASQGVAATTVEQIASAAGITAQQFLAEFHAPVDVLLENDHYPRLLEVFLAESPELSPSGAWIVALDEATRGMDATAWQNETTRQQLVTADPAAAPHAVPVALAAVEATRQAVATRTGLPVDSPKVASFAGALIGSIAALPSGDFPDPASWIAAHADNNETLGVALDRLLR